MGSAERRARSQCARCGPSVSPTVPAVGNLFGAYTEQRFTEALSRVGSFGNKAYLQKAVEMFEDFLGYGWV